MQFRNSLLLQVLDSDGVSHQFSTVKDLNDQSMNPLPMPTLKLSQDTSTEGKIEKFDLSINFKGDPSKVRRVELFSTFDYFVQSKIKMQLVGMVHFSVDTPGGASKILADGSLELEQNKPVLIDSITRNLYNSDPLTDANFAQFSLGQLVESYNARSERLSYKAQSIVQPLGSPHSTTIKLQMHVPKHQQIVYMPGVMEALKFAWVQYLMVLIPTLLIVRAGLSSMFKYRILNAFLVSDLKEKRKII